MTAAGGMRSRQLLAVAGLALAAAVFARAALAADAPGSPAPAAAAEGATTGAPGPASTPGAQTASAPPAVPAEEYAGPRPPPATLRVLNRPIVVFRATFFGVTPAGRVEDAVARIDDILAQGGPGEVGIRPSGQGRVVTVDGRLAFVLLPGDVAGGGADRIEALAVHVGRALERAIAETREARDTQRLLHGVLAVAIATAIFVALLWLLVRFGRWLTLKLVRLAGRASARIRVGGGEVVRSHRAMRVTLIMVRLAGWVLVLLVTFEWLGFVLGRFPYTRTWSEQINSFLLGTLTDILVNTAKALPELMVAVVIVVIARVIDGAQKSFFHRVREGRIHVGWVDRDSAPATRRLITLAIWSFAAVMAYPYIPGSSTDAFKGLTVLLGLMVSVGASGIIGQAASGLILMYTKTMRTGDYVKVGDAEGTVVGMGLFTTRMDTGRGEELTLPNATILGSATRNFSRTAHPPGLVLTVDASIGYDVPWRQVEALLLAAARRTPAVRSQPPPRVLQTALHDFYVGYRLVCEASAAGPEARARAASDLNAAVIDAFNEHGVQIMSPHYLADPARPKVVPKSAWYAAPAKPPPAA